ncbi:MAG: hypothetical protein Ct9H300mP19_13050 [Dehalococcoidia bacterium]|nr:MAG: hypothetical protein Ct9H300mP19_13050 [Dehalococcoidia bacterium]
MNNSKNGGRHSWLHECRRHKDPERHQPTPKSLGKKWGIPHIYAERDEDLFFGYGYAMAQGSVVATRLPATKGNGTISEVLGPSSLETDTISPH